MKKMRLLTIISLAASSSEVTFDQIAEHLNLEEDKIEEFVINGDRGILLSSMEEIVMIWCFRHPCSANRSKYQSG
jgi:hypothetical protein